MRLEINYKKETKKLKHVEAKQYATKQPMDHWRNEREIKRYLDTNEENMRSKTYGMQQDSSKKEVYSNTCLPQETRKSSNKQPKLTPKRTREKQAKPKASRRKEITKIRA